MVKYCIYLIKHLLQLTNADGSKITKKAAVKWAANIIERMGHLFEAVCNLVIYNIQTFMILSQQNA